MKILIYFVILYLFIYFKFICFFLCGLFFTKCLREVLTIKH